MPGDKTVKYLLRDKLHNPKGEYTETQILHRIEKGKYTGDEEVALPPYLEWHRISAIPVFYDAFVKRLYELGLYSPADPPPPTTGFSMPLSSIVEDDAKLTRQESGGETAMEPELLSERPREPVAGGTEAHPSGEGQTIHQSEIDRLFTGSAKSVPPGEGPEIESADSAEPSLKEDLARTTFAERWKRQIQRSPRKTAAIAATIGGLLILGIWPAEKSDSLNSSRPTDAVAGLIPEDEIIGDRAVFRVRLAQAYWEAKTFPGLKQAAENFQAVLRQNPTDLDAHRFAALSLARSLAFEGNPKTLSELTEVIISGRRLAPHDPAFYQAETLAAIFTGDLESARRLSQKNLEADPLGPETFLVLGELLLKEDNGQEALRTLSAVEKNLPQDFQAQLTYAKALLKGEQLDKALVTISRATTLSPLNAEAYSVMGDVLSKKNQLKPAKVTYEIAAKLKPFTSKRLAAYNHFRVGNLANVMGETKLASEQLFLAFHYDPKTYAEYADRIEESARALLLKRTEESYYFDKEYLVHRAQELIENKRMGDASKYLAGLTLIYPKDAEVFVRFGELIEKGGLDKEAYQLARSIYGYAHELDPKAAAPLIHLGDLETSQYNFDRAIGFLAAADSVNPENLEVQLALGRHFYRRQDYRAAEEHFRSAQMLNPANSEVYYYQGLLYRKLQPENVREAMRLFYDAYLREPSNYDALAEWLKLKVLTFDKIFAVKFVRNLQESDAKNPHLYWVMGEIYSANKEFLRAVTQYHRALDLDNTSPRVRISLARALRSVGRLDEAVAEYRLASELDRQNGEGYFEAANILFDARNFTAADQNLELLLKSVPGYPGGRRLRAKVYQALNKQEDAIQEMRKEVAANPFNYRYTIELAELLMEFERYEEATKELTKVSTLTLDAKTPPSVRNEKIRSLLLLSRCYRALKGPETSEGPIKLALTLDSGDPELHRELGYVYLALKRDREAASAFKTYLDRNPAARDADAVKRIISQSVIEE